MPSARGALAMLASPIDAAVELTDGTHVDGVAGLRQALLARRDMFVSTMAEKMLTYALGRGSSTTTGRWSARSRATPRDRITGSRLSYWAL